MRTADNLVITKLKRVTFISFTFMIVELFGGYYASSIAIFADAFHLLSDVVAYSISLYVVTLSAQSSPRIYTFGY
jgi:Co/Zn/Cd efflux system component